MIPSTRHKNAKVEHTPARKQTISFLDSIPCKAKYTVQAKKNKYAESFITSIGTPLKICDLGCGDFNVGKELVQYAAHYQAVDIAQNLIDRNNIKFKASNLTFHCLDIAVDQLPSADCVIIRQVLQHLSNAEVEQVVTKLADFKYVILTEHLPLGDFVPNKDIISGQGIRLKKQSGIDLLASPFCFQVKEEKELLSFVLDGSQGVIVTTLYTVF